MFVVVSYDIVDDKVRAKTAKLINNFGERVQKSVFECRINDRLYLKMKNGIEKLINWEEDSVRYYVLCASCVKNVEISGLGFVREDEDTIIV